MKKVITAMILSLLLVIGLVGCNSEAYKEACNNAELYNEEVAKYEAISSGYNSAVTKIKELNTQLKEAITTAQKVIEKGESPYDEKTLEQLEVAIKNANEAMIEEPATLPVFDELVIERSLTEEELNKICEQAEEDIETIKAITVPEVPTIPNYDLVIEELLNTQTIYQKSVNELKQVTVPTQDFIIERLQLVETITNIEAVTEEHDPNGQLNKPGGYIGCIYFLDENVNQSELIIEPGKDNTVDIGTKGGGAVEIYATEEDARNRDTYLADFDGTIYTSGSHAIVGTCVVRTSGILTSEQQLTLTNQIIEKLLMMEE